MDAMALPLLVFKASIAFGAGVICGGRSGTSVFLAWGAVLPPFAHGDKGE